MQIFTINDQARHRHLGDDHNSMTENDVGPDSTVLHNIRRVFTLVRGLPGSHFHVALCPP